MSSEKRKYELKARAEAQQATRARIAAAAAALHEEIGIAQTTVTDIAKRAGVQRLTVYNHFPDLAALLPACSAHWLAENPQPDLDDAFALPDPAERVREVLERLYGWYRQTERMQLRVQGERSTVPELEALMTGSADPQMRRLADGLAAGFAGEAASADRVRVLAALALDFWTWLRLAREEMGDREAAELMASAVAAGASSPAPV